MGGVRRAIEIEAPQQVVWSSLTDLRAWEKFAPYMKSFQALDQGALRLGSRVKVTPKGLPGSVWKVTEIEEPRSFTWETSAAPGLRLVAGHEANPRTSGTEAVLWLDWKGLLGAALSPLLRIVFRRNIRLASQGLKLYCEQSALPTEDLVAPVQPHETERA